MIILLALTTFLLSILQYYSWIIGHKLKIIVTVPLLGLPIFNIDQELSILSILICSYFFGVYYGMLMIVISVAIHFKHLEVLNPISILNYIVKGISVILLSLLFHNFLFGLPYIILGTKLVYAVFQRLILRFPIITPFRITEVFSIIVYFAISNILMLFF